MISNEDLLFISALLMEREKTICKNGNGSGLFIIKRTQKNNLFEKEEFGQWTKVDLSLRLLSTLVLSTFMASPPLVLVFCGFPINGSQVSRRDGMSYYHRHHLDPHQIIMTMMIIVIMTMMMIIIVKCLASVVA